jgi:hypothetical protein
MTYTVKSGQSGDAGVGSESAREAEKNEKLHLTSFFKVRTKDRTVVMKKK